MDQTLHPVWWLGHIPSHSWVMGEVTQSGSPVNSLTMTPYLSWPILFRTFIYIHYVLDLLSHKLAIYIYIYGCGKKTPCIVGKQNWGFFACQERRHHVFIDDQIASLHLKKASSQRFLAMTPFWVSTWPGGTGSFWSAQGIQSRLSGGAKGASQIHDMSYPLVI